MNNLLQALKNASFVGIADTLNSFYADMLKAGYLSVYETKAILSLGNVAVESPEQAESIFSICELLELYTSRTEVTVGTRTFKADSLFGKANASVNSMIDNRRVNNVSIDDDGAVTFLLQRKSIEKADVVDTSEALKIAMKKFRDVAVEAE